MLQVLQALLLSPDDGAHAPQGRALQLLAAVQGVSVLHEPHVIFGHTYRSTNNCEMVFALDSNLKDTVLRKYLTCPLNFWQYLSVLEPTCNDPCRRGCSSNQHKMDGYPRIEAKWSFGKGFSSHASITLAG